MSPTKVPRVVYRLGGRRTFEVTTSQSVETPSTSAAVAGPWKEPYGGVNGRGFANTARSTLGVSGGNGRRTSVPTDQSFGSKVQGLVCRVTVLKDLFNVEIESYMSRF